MTTQMQEWVKLGTEIGYKGADLQAFIKEQQAITRDDREKEREFEKIRKTEEEETKRVAARLLHEKELAIIEKEKMIKLEEAKEREREMEKEKMIKLEEAKERDREFERERKAAEEETKRILAKLNHEKELAIIEKQKLEVIQKGKKDEAELEIMKIKLTDGHDCVQLDKDSNHDGEDVKEGLVLYRASGGSGKSRPKGPKLTAFDERDDIDSYIHRFEQYAKLEGWPEATWAIYLAALLKGKALDVYTRLPVEEAENYEVLKTALLKRYEKTEEGYRKLFYSARVETGEGQHQFIVRLGSYLMKYVEFSGVEKNFEDLMDLLIREQYLNTCSKELEMFLRERSIKKLDELARNAEQFISAHKSKGSFTNWDMKYEKTGGHRDVKRDDRKESRSPVKSGINTDGKRRCWICNSSKHIAKDCDKKQT
jgi:hypothetical protein